MPFLAAMAQTARTVTTNSPDQDSKGSRGVFLSLDINGVTGTNPTLDVKVQRKDPISGNYVDLPGGAFAQKTDGDADSTFGLTIYPGIVETTNVCVSDVISREWRVVGTIGGTDTPTFNYSVSAQLIP